MPNIDETNNDVAGTVGVALSTYNLTLPATYLSENATGTIQIENLPFGCVFTPTGSRTATITGTPLQAGTFVATAYVDYHDGNAPAYRQGYTLDFVIAAGTLPNISTTFAITGSARNPVTELGDTINFSISLPTTYNYFAASTPHPNLPLKTGVNMTVEGDLPAGLTLNVTGQNTGTITGTPSRNVEYEDEPVFEFILKVTYDLSGSAVVADYPVRLLYAGYEKGYNWTPEIIYGQFASGGNDAIITQEESGVFKRAERGFHTGRVRYRVWLGNSSVGDIFKRGSIHPKGVDENQLSLDNDYSRLFVADADWTEELGSENEYIVDVLFKGFFGWTTRTGVASGSKPQGLGGYSRRVRTQAGSFNGQNITSPNGTGAHIIGDPLLTVSYQYIQRTKPDCSLVNTNITPPDAPDPPYLHWTQIGDFIIYYPSGWILEARDYEDIQDEDGNALLYLVQDGFVWREDFRPGDI